MTLSLQAPSRRSQGQESNFVFLAIGFTHCVSYARCSQKSEPKTLDCDCSCFLESSAPTKHIKKNLDQDRIDRIKAESKKGRERLVLKVEMGTGR